MELIKFMFSDFWVWLGFVMVIAVIFNGVTDIVKAARTTKPPEPFEIDLPKLNKERADNED